MTDEEPVTLAVVARVAGVSSATASRALNNRNGVKPDVRDRVKLVADSLAYRPNRAARNLAKGRSSVVGFVISSDELRVDPYGASLVHAVARAAESMDHSLMLLLASNEPGDHVTHSLRDGLIDGLLVSAVAIGKPWVERLFDSAIPAVLIGSHPNRVDVPQVDIESRNASRVLVEHLFAQGCERIAIITGPLDRVDASSRLAGYRDAHEQRGLVVDESLVLLGDFSHLSGQTAAEKLVHMSADGLFACNDEMALGAISVLARAGRRVPDDIAVAGFDGTHAAERVGISLTTARQPFGALGDAVFAQLLAILDGESPSHLRLISPEITIGDSSLKRLVGPAVAQ